jgi:hypothetical protein
MRERKTSRKNAACSTALGLLIVLSSFTVLAPAISIAEAAECAPLRVSALKVDGYQGPNVPKNTLDNNLSTRWSSSGKGSWIQLDMAKQINLCNLDIAWYQGNERQYNFAIAVSEETNSHKTVFSGKSSGKTNQEERYEFADIKAKSVRITVSGNTENNWASLTEIDVRGHEIPAVSSATTTDFANVGANSVLSGSYTLVVTAADPERISKIDLYVDSRYIKTEYNDPYEFRLDTTKFSDGNHTLKTVAKERSGNLLTKNVTVSFKNDPAATPATNTISFANVGANSVLSGSYTLVVTAADPERISKIDLYVDSRYIKTEYNDPYEFGVGTSQFSDGPHLLKAVAEDESGSEITATNAVVFKNAQPAPTLPPPSPSSDDKYLLATLLQYVDTDELVDIYKPNMLNSDKPRIHVGLNKQVTDSQLNGLLSLPGQHGFEFFSLAEIKANAPKLKAKGIEVIDYDLEPGDGHSPSSDLANPVASIKAASQAAHDNGLLFRCSPARALTTTYGAQMAPYCDQYHIQAQALQDRPSEYESYVEGMVTKLRAANPNVQISVQVSTQREAASGMTLLETMKTDFARVADKVDGVSVWFSNDDQALSVVKSFSEWFNANYRQ